MPEDLAFLDRKAERARPVDPGWAEVLKAQTEHYLLKAEAPKAATERADREDALRQLGAWLEAAREGEVVHPGGPAGRAPSPGGPPPRASPHRPTAARP